MTLQIIICRVGCDWMIKIAACAGWHRLLVDFGLLRLFAEELLCGAAVDGSSRGQSLHIGRRLLAVGRDAVGQHTAAISDALGLIDGSRIQGDEERRTIRAAVARLGEREREIIELRYGLRGGRELTQKEVAEHMGISQSYISRLEKRIMLRLRKELDRLTGCA